MAKDEDIPDLVVDVAKAIAKADGVNLKQQVTCGGCGMQHFLWEKYLQAAKQFVVGYKAVSGKTWDNDRTN